MWKMMSRALWAGALVVGLTGCGLDVSFEEKNRGLVESFVPESEMPDAGMEEPDTDEEEAPSLSTFNHAAWGGVLGLSLQGACVDYQSIGASDERISVLSSYAEQLKRADLESGWTREDRVAFWVNAYNALTVMGVVEERQDDPDFRVDKDGFVFFQTRRWDVGGMLLSLDLIEHGILRADQEHASWGRLEDEDLKAAILEEHEKVGAFDARLHFALNCASRSCPDLRGEPYRGERLEEQLQEQAVIFLEDATKGAGENGVSSLFQWFAGDFGGTENVSAFIAGFRNPEGVNTGTYLDYSWEANDLQDAEVCRPRER